MQVLAVNYQDDAATIAAHWRENGFDFPTFTQYRDAASRAFGVEFYTAMFALSRDQQVLWRGHQLADAVVRPLLGLAP